MRHVGIRPGPHPGGCARRRHRGRRELPGQSNLPFSTFPAAPKCIFLCFLRLFAANQFKCLSLNHLRSQTVFPVQGQSRLIKVNQGAFYALCVNCAPRPFLRFEAGSRARQHPAPKSMAAIFSYFQLIPLNSTYFHFAGPPGRAGTFTMHPAGQTRSNPVKPQKPGLTGVDPDSESELTGLPETLRPQKGPDR